MTRDQLINELSTIRRGANFLSLHKYRNQFGEIANYNITFRANYKRVLETSIKQLNAMAPKSAIRRQAKTDLIASCQASLVRLNEIRDDGYTYIEEGVKVKQDTGELYLYGLVHKKDVLERGAHKEVKHSRLTAAKNTLRSQLQIGKFRQFRIGAGDLEKIVIEGRSLKVDR